MRMVAPKQNRFKINWRDENNSEVVKYLVGAVGHFAAGFILGVYEGTLVWHSREMKWTIGVAYPEPSLDDIAQWAADNNRTLRLIGLEGHVIGNPLLGSSAILSDDVRERYQQWRAVNPPSPPKKKAPIKKSLKLAPQDAEEAGEDGETPEKPMPSEGNDVTSFFSPNLEEIFPLSEEDVRVRDALRTEWPNVVSLFHAKTLDIAPLGANMCRTPLWNTQVVKVKNAREQDEERLINNFRGRDEHRFVCENPTSDLTHYCCDFCRTMLNMAPRAPSPKRPMYRK